MIWQYLNEADLKTVSTKANVFYTSPNEILLNTGDISNEIYVIKQGICEILNPETKEVVNELRARNTFGVLECLLRLPAFYTIRAATHVQIFSISRKYLLRAIEIPQIKDAIEFAKEQPEYSHLQVRSQPFLSYRPPDPIPNVERFRLPRKHEQDYAFLQPFHRLGFLSVLRYTFPRFTIRPDGEYLMRMEWVRAGCALLSALLFPGCMYLKLHANWLYYFEILLDTTAYLDILQRMLVGYFNEKGILVYHPASTAGHYLRGAFLVDLFGCLPFENLNTYTWEIYVRFNLTENTWNLHLACYFWVVYETTKTGYNTINPSNFNIMKIMFTGMVVGAMLTTYFSVRIISVRSNVNKPLAAFQQHMKDMAAFMRREHLSPKLQRDVLAHYGYTWDKMGGLDYRNVLKLCDQITLRTDAILHIYGSTFTMCPILSQCDVSLLRIIGRAMHSVHFLQNTRIIEKDDVIKDIYFVDSGNVELIDEENRAVDAVRLTKGSIFGELDGASSFRSPVCLVSLSKVHLLQINATAFHKIISDFSDVVQLLNSYRPNNEVLFVSVLQVISTMVFMIYVGEFSNIIQYQSYRSFGFYSKYLELQEFLKNNRVSSNLVKLVNKYSLHLWRESRGVQVPHFLKAAPHCLRLRLMSAAFGHHLTNNSVFKNCEAAFLRQLVGCLRLYTYNKGMFVVRESEITDSMYLIHTGRVEERKDEDNQKKTFYTGDFFGMLQGTTHELPYMHSYCTLTKCQILTLNLNDWEELLKHFPASKNTIYRNLYLDGSPPNPIKGKKDTKGKKVRKVAIINSYNEDSSDYISDKATEPMITSPTEHKYTESEPIDNLEEVSSLPSEEFVSILISESAASNLISEKVKLEQISGSPDNRSKLDKSNTPKEIDNQEISNKSSKGQDNTIPTIASIITLQGTKDTTFSNFTIISTGSTNADSLLQLEDEEITSDLIAKLDRVNKPTASTSNDYETSETDKQNLKELKYAETDADKKISGYEMKTVEEYIFERQELDESISLERQQAKFSPERKEPVNLPTSSRTNRYLYRVRYQDDNSKDASPNESITKEGKGRKEGSPDETSSNEMKIMSPDSETTDDPKEKNENTKSGNERKNMKQSKKKDD